MKYQIRGERPGNEEAIDIVNCRAFNSMEEPNLVRGMRDYYPAYDPSLARDLIATLKPEEISQHPSGWLAQNALDPAWSKAEANASQAAMVCPLREGVLQPYLQAVKSGERLPGSSNWPWPFILCG